MDIKQQTQNVAAQGRYGDSMLLHVNPAEVKGLASAMPITVNPQTGQPEAFLPFLAPVLGSMLAPTILAGTGLSAAAMAGIGAGLATYVQTGGSGSKALLSGLTAGMGTKALNTGAEAAIGADAAIQPGIDAAALPGATDLSVQAAQQTARDTAIQAAQESSKLGFNQAGNFRGFTPGEALSNTFSGGFDSGAQALATGMMSPSGVAAGVGAGTQGVIASQEQFEREMAQLTEDEEERKRRMYEMYPEQIPIASGGSTSFVNGGRTGYRRGRNVYYDPRETNDFNIGSGEYYEPGGRSQTTTRQTRPIPPGYMAGFMPEYRYFQGDDPKTYLTRYARDIQDSSSQQPQNMEAPSPMPSYGGFRPPMPLQPPFMGGRGYQSYQPRFGGYGGFGNPFMQSPRYQSFYGNPQMGGMFNPYARFNQQPIQPYFAPPPVYNPPPQPPIDTPPPSDGGDLPPTDGPLLPPINDNIGRKGRTRIGQPIAPPDDFVNPIVVGGTAQPPVNTPPPVSTLPVNTPSPTVTLPIEGGRDVTIPDFSKINTPNPRDNFISIGGPGGGFNDDRVFAGGSPTFNEQGPTFTPPTPPTPAAPGNTPMTPPTGFKPMGGMPMFGAPMFAGGGDTDLPNKGLEALAKTEKGREALKAMGYQEGGPTDMMQDPIVKEMVSTLKKQGINLVPYDRENPSTVKQKFMDKWFETIGENKRAFVLPTKLVGKEVDINIPLKYYENLDNFKNIVAEELKHVPHIQESKFKSLIHIAKDFGKQKLSKIPQNMLWDAYGAMPKDIQKKLWYNPTFQKLHEKTTDMVKPRYKTPGMLEHDVHAVPNEVILKQFGLVEKKEGASINPETNLEEFNLKGKPSGYQKGGPTDMMQDPLTQEVIKFILGESDNEDIIMMFVNKYGTEQFQMLRSAILKQAAGNPNAQTEGLIQGNGNSGMADDLPMNIGKFADAAVSQDEYIVPADVVSMLGDGSSDAGSKQLDGMLDRVRMAKTGGKTQASPINPNKVLPA